MTKGIKPIVKLSFARGGDEDGSQFGRGVASLCQGVRNLGSLNAAAKSMGMAYSKAWRIVKNTEEELGMQLLNRDGAHGSTLTDAGNRLLDAWLDLSDEMQKEAERRFKDLS